MKDFERRSPEIPTEIKRFTIETSLEDVKSKRSSFNPYPEKGDMLIWSTHGLEWNPFVIVKYPKTREIFYTVIPSTNDENSINLQPCSEEDGPQPSLGYPTGEYLGRWQTIEESWAHMVVDNFLSTELDKTNIKPLLEKAIAPTQDEQGKPKLKPTKEAFMSIHRMAAETISEGAWKEGMKMVQSGIYCSTYKLYGTEVNNAETGIFHYTGKGLIMDAFPQLVEWDTPLPRDYSTIIDISMHPFYLADDLTNLLRERVRNLALNKAIELEENPNIRGNYILLKNMVQKKIKTYEEQFQTLQTKLGTRPQKEFKELLPPPSN